jgi:hypothetical protein
MAGSRLWLLWHKIKALVLDEPQPAMIRIPVTEKQASSQKQQQLPRQ